MNIKENLTEVLREFEYDAECCEAMEATCDKMLADEATRDALCEKLELYRGGELDWKGLTAVADEAAERLGIHKAATRLVAYISLVPYSYHFFEERGLGRREWYDSMIDLKWKARETRSVDGLWGTHTDWFREFFTAERVAFGRLQFNYAKAPVDFECEEFSVRKGDRVVAIHIPTDDRAPFDKAHREAAYDGARRFFAKDFEGGRVIFYCSTWLLFKEHERLLPEGSNIRDFLGDFHLVPNGFVASEGNIWRIFGIRDYNGDPDSLPEDSSLMRIYKQFMKDGGVIGTQIGYKL